ncbi:hypothetical protein [Marinobacterium jannaschii]|uniref:hypothetical protein n=1 Tax=Marinobacterium jannaschii TaxID=64970 RepID=UPI0004885FB7|nr:hypothetical protein [Marinobacterium jannaschii]
MKRIFLLAALWAPAVFAQESVTFSLSYQPSSVYQISHEIDADNVLSFAGDHSQLPEKLKGRIPLSFKMRKYKNTEIVTGGVSENGGYPIKLSVTSDTTYAGINGSPLKQVSDSSKSARGLTVDGVISSDGQFDITAVSGSKVKKSDEQLIKSIFEQLSALKAFEGKTVSVGEVLSLETPIKIQVPTIGIMDYQIDIDYKLESIEQGMASFRPDYKLKIASNIKGQSIAVDGKGQGILTYDIENQLTSENSSTIELQMDIPTHFGVFNFSSVAKSTSSTSRERIPLSTLHIQE